MIKTRKKNSKHDISDILFYCFERIALPLMFQRRVIVLWKDRSYIKKKNLKTKKLARTTPGLSMISKYLIILICTIILIINFVKNIFDNNRKKKKEKKYKIYFSVLLNK